MATTVYDTLEIQLQDGTDIEVKPLPIKRLRKATALIAKFSDEAQDEDADSANLQDIFVDMLIDVAVLTLGTKNPELVEDRDALEDILDLPTLTKIVEVATGWKLNEENPKAPNGLAGMN